MVNMYSMGGMGYSPMMGMGGSSSGNVYENYKAKYGVGPADFGTKPYPQEYPYGIIKGVKATDGTQNSFLRFLKKCFLQ